MQDLADKFEMIKFNMGTVSKNYVDGKTEATIDHLMELVEQNLQNDAQQTRQSASVANKNQKQ